MSEYQSFVRNRRLSSHIVEGLLVLVAVFITLDFFNARLSNMDAQLDSTQLQIYAMEYVRVGEADEALALLDVALFHAQQPSATLYAARGQTLMMLGQFEQAVADFSMAIQLEPNNEVWHRALYMARLEIDPSPAQR